MYQQMLLEFHTKYNHHIEQNPTIPPQNIIELRRKLIHEEVDLELMDVLDKCNFRDLLPLERQRLLVELADALADSIYVIVGTAIAFGIPIDLVFTEIHNSNMTKSMEKDTKSIPGKTIKGPNYIPPDLNPILFSNGWLI